MGCTAAHVQPMRAEVIDTSAGGAWKGEGSESGLLKEERTAWKESQSLPSEAVAPKRSKSPRSLDTNCYPELVVISGGSAVQPRCMGVFTKSGIKPTRRHDWRPLYRNQNDKFLYYCAAKKMWLVSSDFNQPEGQLMSHSDVQFPQESSLWKASKGPSCTIKVIGKGAGLLQRNQDGIVIGDYVYIEKHGEEAGMLSEGDRGRVTGMMADQQALVEVEGKCGESFPVATWKLRILTKH